MFELRIKVDHFTPRKRKLVEKYRADSNNARLYVVTLYHGNNCIHADVQKLFENDEILLVMVLEYYYQLSFIIFEKLMNILKFEQ